MVIEQSIIAVPVFVSDFYINITPGRYIVLNDRPILSFALCRLVTLEKELSAMYDREHNRATWWNQGSLPGCSYSSRALPTPFRHWIKTPWSMPIRHQWPLVSRGHPLTVTCGTRVEVRESKCACKTIKMFLRDD